MVRNPGASDLVPEDEPLLAIEPSLEIGGAIRTGIKWKIATQILSEGTRMTVTFVLARLLTPADYGLAGIAIVCATFTHVFVDPGLGTALVQRRRIDEVDRSTVFWTTVIVGLVFTVGGVAASPLVADAFGQPKVAPLFAVLSLTFALNALAVTQMALLNRHLAYRSLEIREMAATVVGAVVALACAIAGFGAWAIVMNFFMFSLVSTILVWRLSAWRPRLLFGRQSFRDLGSFGIKLFWSRILMWGNFNADNMLIGRFLGSAALGAYSLAYNVMFMPMTRIGIPITQVMSPAYARMQDEPERLREAWLGAKRMLAALLVPCFAAMVVVAPDLVPTAFGRQWEPAVRPLQLLSLAGVAHSLVAMDQSVLQATGRAGTMLRLNILLAVVTLTAFVCGLPFGVAGVAGAYAVARWVLAPIDLWVTAKGTGIRARDAILAGVVILPVAAGAGVLALVARLGLIEAGLTPAARLLVTGVAFLAAYVVLLATFSRPTAREIRDRVWRRPRPIEAV